jgi:hypothetical protein
MIAAVRGPDLGKVCSTLAQAVNAIITGSNATLAATPLPMISFNFNSNQFNYGDTR